MKEIPQEIKVEEEVKPVEEIKVEEEVKPVEEIKVEEVKPVEKVKPVEEVKVKEVKPVEEIKVEENSSKSNNKGLGVYNIILKIIIAILSVGALILFTICPIQKFDVRVSDEITYESSYTGFELVYYSIVGIYDTDLSDIQELYQDKIEELLEKYNVESIDDLSSSQIEELSADFPFILPMLWDGEESYENPNTMLVIQLIANAVVFLLVESLLLCVVIYSIVSIFRKQYLYKRLIKFYIIALALTLLFVNALKIMALNETSILSSTTIGNGSLYVLIIILVTLLLVYIYEVINRFVKLNIKKLVFKTFISSIIVVSIFIMNGVFGTISYRNSEDDKINFEYEIQTSVNAFDYGLTNNDYMIDHKEYPIYFQM